MQSASAPTCCMDGLRVERAPSTPSPRGGSTVLDLSRVSASAGLLPDGVGIIAKLVLDTERGRLAPALFPARHADLHRPRRTRRRDPRSRRRRGPRSYSWIFPSGAGERPDQAYFFCTNTQTTPCRGQRLVWQATAERRVAVRCRRIELEQSGVVPLHEDATSVSAGEGGAGSARACNARRRSPGTCSGTSRGAAVARSASLEQSPGCRRSAGGRTPERVPALTVILLVSIHAIRSDPEGGVRGVVSAASADGADSVWEREVGRTATARTASSSSTRSTFPSRRRATGGIVEVHAIRA